MHDGGKILTGLALFLVIALFPMWSRAFAGKFVPADPKIVTQERACVAPKEVMRATHMDLLNQWRDAVVRDGRRTVTVNGKAMAMSLTSTCMSCHPNKAEFCDSCHNQLAVAPYCWDCHVEPKPQGRV